MLRVPWETTSFRKQRTSRAMSTCRILSGLRRKGRHVKRQEQRRAMISVVLTLPITALIP